MDAIHVPRELAERFLPQEAVRFEVLRANGRTRLWRSTTQPHLLHGYPRPAAVHHHVTVGPEAHFLLMRSADAARVAFDLLSLTKGA